MLRQRLFHWQVCRPYRSLQHLSGRGTRAQEIHQEDPVLREADAAQAQPLPFLISGISCRPTAGPQGPVLGSSHSFQFSQFQKKIYEQIPLFFPLLA